MSQRVGQAVGIDAEKRARNVSFINSKLARMQADGAVLSSEHRLEDRRDGNGGQIDIWELSLLGDPHPFTYTFAAARALVRGYDLRASLPT